MLTLFADKTVPKTQTHTNSDGSTTELIASINHMLIATNGSVLNDPIGMNGVQSFTPLGNNFKVSTYSFPVDGILVDYLEKLVVNYIYTVDNYVELTCLQLEFLIVGTMLISGDFYLSARGLHGFLAKKPVMTFDLPAGIERRTMVMSFWTCSGMMALGYPDVVCLYYGSSAVVWFFVVIFLGASYYCLFGVIIGLVTRIPSPFSHVITISDITMCYTAVLLAQLVHVKCSATTAVLLSN
ncbi:hypothetical protein AeMF1_007986 [Aphanomyces euteiches]|nr:hypothetical protein AeMF1_007986 [Aphanomyces euteiches]KAH9168222.1 hypothetical protein AeNC1_017971 [Aphanomyces euteiches]